MTTPQRTAEGPTSVRSKPPRIRQSFVLREFYCAYQFWLDHGAPEWRPFTRQEGLCGNVVLFAHLDAGLRRHSNDMHDEMLRQFDRAKLSTRYPFDPYGNYHAETAVAAAHLNPARRAWVKDHAR